MISRPWALRVQLTLTAFVAVSLAGGLLAV